MEQEQKTEDVVLDQLAQKAKECHQFNAKRAQKFASQAKALQKNLELRKKQKQALENKK